MTRFKKGTTDHDGDGKMGGSKKAAAEPKSKPDKAGSNDPASKSIARHPA